MCGFAGFFDREEPLTDEKYLWMALARRMAGRIAHRGPDDRGVHVSASCALAHVRLAVMDPANGAQPMTFMQDGFSYTIAYNGEIYNADELRDELRGYGYSFQTNCDTEVVLKSYMCFGEPCAEKLNGIFAFAVDDERLGRVFLCRDRFGVKPLFYTFSGSRLVFASEIKALFEYPGIRPEIGRTGICEVFGIGPARTPGCGVFENIREIRPGHCAHFDRDGFSEYAYFTLEARPYTDDYDTSVRTVRELLDDIVQRQLVSDVPLCTFLSGGLDSSIITAIAAEKRRARGQSLQTYSFEYSGNEAYFEPSSYQPDRDEPWAEKVAALLGTEHTQLICGSGRLADFLTDAVIAKDLPGMADIDASLVCFCREVKRNHVVAVCGECADEVFAGYPWYHRKNPEGVFPWSPELSVRTALLKPELAHAAGIEAYARERCQETLDAVPVLRGESAENRRFRELTYLNLYWFMATLLERKDRCSMYSGLEVRVPYADHRLIQYVFNTPRDIRAPHGVVKGLLRDAGRGLLPDDVLDRKKSPYPKTHNPHYEQILKKRLSDILCDPEQPIHALLSEEAVQGLLHETFDYGHPWFGQLMAGPQLLAYLIQINIWLNRYKIRITL
ncbi:MAG: asparagine synthase (glutamine-hydrolyzing) [Hominenteromicrobium sp.]